MSITDLILIGIFILVVLVIITLIIIALTTGFKNTGRQMGGLYCITAPPSNGKSYVATSIAVTLMKQGRKVFSNYPIVYDNGYERYETRVLTKNMLLQQNFNNSVLIIDEAHQWFWSRKFKDFTEEYKNWFSTLSQHQISLYYIIQHEDRVETIINDCANLFGEIQKTEIPFLEIPICFTITWWNRELDMQLGRTNMSIEPYHVERIWFDKDIAHSYDTMFFGKDKRPEYDGITWINFLKQKDKDYEYIGSKDYSIKSQIINIFLEKIYKPVITIYFVMRKRWSEMGKTFDRDDNEELYEADGGVPSGVSRNIVKKDLPSSRQEINEK